jgi:hypothetical protein
MAAAAMLWVVVMTMMHKSADGCCELTDISRPCAAEASQLDHEEVVSKMSLNWEVY